MYVLITESHTLHVVIHFGASSGYIRHFVLEVHTNYKSAKLEWNMAYESASVSIYLRDEKMYKMFIFSVFPVGYKGVITIKTDLVS